MGASVRRRRRSNRLLAAAIAVAIVAGVGGGSAFAYANVKGRADRLQAALVAELQAGQHELEAGKASLTQANSKRDPSLIIEAVNRFATAKAHFVAASSLADNSRLLHDLEQIPAAGYSVYTRHATVDAVAEMGVALSEAGQELSDLDGKLIKPPGSGQAAHTLLTTIDQMQAGLLSVRLDLDRAQRAAEKVDVSLLPRGQQASFLRAHNAIAAAQNGLDEFGRLVPVLKEVLGGNGPRTYVIEQVDPAELRAGGGFIGTYSLLRADQGSLTLIKSGNAYDLADPRPSPDQAGFVAQPSPLREVIPWISWSFVDSNVYPDFPSNAIAASNFVQPRLGIKVDAVISIDYYVVAKMLEFTGPLDVPGYGLTLDAANLIPLLVSGAAAGDSRHKAIVHAVAGPLMERIASLSADRWPALISVLNGLAAGRHLQVYSHDPAAEREIVRVGWSGTLQRTQAEDYAMEVESNYFGDKANYFLTRHYTVELTRRGSSLHHKIAVDIVNKEPIGTEERVVYKADFRLYVDSNISSASNNLRPVKYSNPPPPPGIQLLGGWLPDVACCGGQGRAIFEYDTKWTMNDTAIYRLYWQKQPGTVSDRVDVFWNDGSGHAFNVSGDLSQDRVISITPSGVMLSVGQPALATLPSLSLG